MILFPLPEVCFAETNLYFEEYVNDATSYRMETNVSRAGRVDCGGFVDCWLRRPTARKWVNRAATLANIDLAPSHGDGDDGCGTHCDPIA